MRTLDAMPGDKPAYLGSKEETLKCETCGNNWTRISRRGVKPKRCPICIAKAAEAKAEAKRISAPQSSGNGDDRMALARAAKAERAAERAQQRSEEEAARRESMRAQLPAIDAQWQEAFSLALEENTPEAWSKCDTLMNSYVSIRRAA